MKQHSSLPYLRQRTQNFGFTVIEVMMSLTVLTIGILGILALQKATLVSNNIAQQSSVANQIARTWIDRLKKDSTRWNHPSPMRASSDLADSSNGTAWLREVLNNNNKWIRPGAVTMEPNASPGFDLHGFDLPVSDETKMSEAMFCTHIRLTWIYTDELMRAEVRVFWLKRPIPNETLYNSYGLTKGICDAAGDPGLLGKDDVNFHWVYAVTAIGKATAQ